MIICFCCVRNEKKYAKCIRIDKKYEFAILKVNFFDINQIMTKFEREKLKIKLSWKIANELIRSKYQN